MRRSPYCTSSLRCAVNVGSPSAFCLLLLPLPLPHFIRSSSFLFFFHRLPQVGLHSLRSSGEISIVLFPPLSFLVLSSIHFNYVCFLSFLFSSSLCAWVNVCVYLFEVSRRLLSHTHTLSFLCPPSFRFPCAFFAFSVDSTYI